MYIVVKLIVTCGNFTMSTTTSQTSIHASWSQGFVNTLHKMPQPGDNIVTTLQGYNKVKISIYVESNIMQIGEH